VASGCQRSIVRAAPPSVATPPPSAEPTPQPESLPLPTEAKPEPASEPVASPVAVNPAPRPAPSRPRPAPAETEPPKPKAEAPPAPQISPVLSPRQQADATRHTADDIRAAEKALQLASGKQLNASQKDLVGKISGFLSQAHEAIRANDWVRAENLAHKAQVLAAELDKSL
jgi:DNA polymerase III subunit gamma/tau